MASIYKIYNDINDKLYIGKTEKTIEERFKEHCQECTRDHRNHRPLYSAMKKYGKEHFFIQEIENITDISILEEREIYWIEYYNSYGKGYNATKGGDGKHLCNAKLILELWNDGFALKEIQEITKYSRETIKQVFKNNNISDEDVLNRGNLLKSQPINMIDKDTNIVIKTFKSFTEAGVFTNKKMGYRHIQEVCAGKRKTAYGYKWEKVNT